MNPANYQPGDIRWSSLKHILTSPAHYKYHLDNPVVETDAMLEGSAFDALVMPRDDAPKIVTYGARRYGKEWEAFAAENSNKIILPVKSYDTVMRMVNAVKCDSAAMEALSCGEPQRFLRWQDGNRWCAGTPDVCGEGLVDLKRTDANPFKFNGHAYRMKWHAQLAWYEAAMVALGMPAPNRVSIVACDPKPPHCVTVFDLAETRIEEGEKMFRAALERLAVCEANDHWPGYSEIPVVWEGWEEE